MAASAVKMSDLWGHAKAGWEAEDRAPDLGEDIAAAVREALPQPAQENPFTPRNAVMFGVLHGGQEGLSLAAHGAGRWAGERYSQFNENFVQGCEWLLIYTLANAVHAKAFQCTILATMAYVVAAQYGRLTEKFDIGDLDVNLKQQGRDEISKGNRLHWLTGALAAALICRTKFVKTLLPEMVPILMRYGTTGAAGVLAGSFLGDDFTGGKER